MKGERDRKKGSERKREEEMKSGEKRRKGRNAGKWMRGRMDNPTFETWLCPCGLLTLSNISMVKRAVKAWSM